MTEGPIFWATDTIKPTLPPAGLQPVMEVTITQEEYHLRRSVQCSRTNSKDEIYNFASEQFSSLKQ